MEIKVKKLSPQATVPTKANDSDAGWDLYASEDAIIDPSKAELLSTHISVAIPEGYVVCLWNSSDKYCVVNAGERIAQILFQQVPTFTLREVDSLDDSDRGIGGFGSSGL